MAAYSPQSSPTFFQKHGKRQTHCIGHKPLHIRHVLSHAIQERQIHPHRRAKYKPKLIYSRTADDNRDGAKHTVPKPRPRKRRGSVLSLQIYRGVAPSIQMTDVHQNKASRTLGKLNQMSELSLAHLHATPDAGFVAEPRAYAENALQDQLKQRNGQVNNYLKQDTDETCQRPSRTARSVHFTGASRNKKRIHWHRVKYETEFVGEVHMPWFSKPSRIC
ncbi:hypothetical protein BKA93DRAFT_380563 [Sparassis latifolia]